MPRPRGHIAAIAHRYGKSAEYVRNVIKRNPDLGVKIEPNKSIVLDANQQSALCAKIEDELAKYDFPELQLTAYEKPTNGNPYANESDAEIGALRDEIDGLKEEIAGLKADLAAAETDAKVAEARAEERQNHIDDLKNAQGEQRKLLEAAQAEAASYRKSVFGFYRKVNRSE